MTLRYRASGTASLELRKNTPDGRRIASTILTKPALFEYDWKHVGEMTLDLEKTAGKSDLLLIQTGEGAWALDWLRLER